MDRKSFLELHEAICTAARNLSERKGQDYSGTEDTLANLKRTEAMDIVSAPRGVLVRMGDKFSRLSELTREGREAAVQSESLFDTLLDVVNYACLCMALLVERGDIVLPENFIGRLREDEPDERQGKLVILPPVSEHPGYQDGPPADGDCACVDQRPEEEGEAYPGEWLHLCRRCVADCPAETELNQLREATRGPERAIVTVCGEFVPSPEEVDAPEQGAGQAEVPVGGEEYPGQSLHLCERCRTACIVAMEASHWGPDRLIMAECSRFLPRPEEGGQ